MSALPNLDDRTTYEAAGQHQRAQRKDGGYGEGGHGLGGLRFREAENLRWQVFAGDGSLDTIRDRAGQLVWPLRYSGSRNADGFGRCGGRSAKKADGIGFLHDAGHLSALRPPHASTLSVKPAQMLTMLTLKERAERALAAGFSNAQLAEAAGVTSGAVSQWLTNTKRLKAKSAIGLAKLTGWRVEWWAEGIGPQTDAPHGNVDMQAQPLSHSQQQDAPTATKVGGGSTQDVSFDAEFVTLSPSERARWLLLWAAAFDHPPDAVRHMEGLWIKNAARKTPRKLGDAPGPDPVETPAPAAKTSRKDRKK